ncbi:helix-turn-helix domain-containing protein [Lactobacillus ultunensis]|uniref:DNA-binding helix-turn-helix protein n=1 Tax=Lactobacillus ultunensis DSM 16047 TaxID=525365 RepID=C2EQ71_9LACO|nr:Rgg/GadR/MutR family transcriptional regulator [Lactobacillus ultunensis]EEJ71292.1 DNA-binding helix-turn-helix protein [Lactobacillus ultunensis DSM 16047]KRL81616.1 transcriptional regulator [Lactobacillus ultunensis DSM 16047]
MKRRNAKITKTIGPKFKEIRKEAHISLKELAKKVGIVSPSTLSRWERGEEGLPVEIFEKLLTTMNISYNEIIANEVEVKQVMMKIELLYQKNDIDGLKNYATQLLNEYYQEKENYLRLELLIKSAIAVNFYIDLTGIDITNKKYKMSLTKQFENINYWFKKEIILFGDVQLLLDNSTVYELSRSLISKMYDKSLVEVVVSISLLNAVFVLIKRKTPDKAKIILNATVHLNFPKNDVVTKVRIKFMKVLLNYVDAGKEYPIRQFLDSLDDEHLKESWIFATKQIRFF